ncbi:MAG: hypothetical protein ACRDLF_00015 [Solirubrobacteraceae bacterium]
MWLMLLALGLIKLPIAALMLWIPFRSDGALESRTPAEAAPADSSEEDDGGSKTLPGTSRGPRVGGGPHRPRAPLGGRRPRRGPPGCTAGGRAASPGRARTARRGAPRVTVRR